MIPNPNFHGIITPLHGFSTLIHATPPDVFLACWFNLALIFSKLVVPSEGPTFGFSILPKNTGKKNTTLYNTTIVDIINISAGARVLIA